MPGFSALRSFILRSFLLLPAVIFSVTINAQLCEGSLGDPAVNITFGSGGNSSYTPPGGYIYTSSSCPNDGYYTITTSSSGCFGSTWHTVSSDHTGEGNFLLVNASYDPGDFFVETVSDLCPNTTYEFAAWMMNVINRFGTILPDITFRIETPDGTILNTFNTGGIDVNSSPIWKQYGFFFTTPVNNPVIVLRMTNNAPGGIGNDIALDDITFRPCGSKITSGIVGLSSDTIDVCEGYTDSYTFNADISSGYISPLYQWQLSTDQGRTWNNIAGATMLTYILQPLTMPGNYWYRLTVIEASVSNISSCRIASDILIINVHSTPVVDAGADRIMLVDNPITLAGTATGEQITYSWSPDVSISSIEELNPTISPSSDITYILSAVSSFGCTDTDYVNIKVVMGIYVPTAFTPNGDGKNDKWEIPFLDPSFGGTVSVFNRWGQLVYHTSADIVSWDGKLNGISQASGTYIYMITFKNSEMQLKGTVTLLR